MTKETLSAGCNFWKVQSAEKSEPTEHRTSDNGGIRKSLATGHIFTENE